MKCETQPNDIVETVAIFGSGRLVKLRSGRYRFEGGSRPELLEALEWTSLFCPELVFDVRLARPSLFPILEFVQPQGSPV